MNEIKISIILATYNAEKYLTVFFDSYRSQATQNVELIVIDGSSIDNTITIIKENLELVSFWVSEKDNSIYEAWNKGIEKANGEWIAFIGADDILKPFALLNLLNLLDNIRDPSINLISARAEIISKDKNRKVIGREWDPTYINICHVMSLHNKKLFMTHGKFNTSYQIAGDYEFLLRCRYDIKALHFNEIIAEIGINGISSSLKSLKEIRKARVESGAMKKIPSYILFFYSIALYIINKFSNCRKFFSF